VSGHRQQTRAYLELKREVEDVLYEVDPDGCGTSIGSPRDEYSDVAARVIPMLLGAQSAEAAELPWSDPDLRARLVSIAERHRSRLQAGDVPASG
jgi:hypothetical protein